MAAQTPYGHHAEVHQQLGRRLLLRPLLRQYIHEPVLGQGQPARIQEEEQRFAHGPLDHAVENAVDLAAVGVRQHTAGPVVLDHLVQAVERLLLRLGEEALHRDAMAGPEVGGDS